MKNQKNILFVIIDQLRADCIFGAMAEHIKTPNLQALMADAVTFKQHYSVTNPCGPARASVLTGQYAMNHRSVRNGTPLAHDTPNIAKEIRKVGYDPMLFGYTDTSPDPRVHHKNDPVASEYEEVLPGFNEKVEMRLESSYPWRAYLKSKGYDLPSYDQFYVPQTPKGQKSKLDDPSFYKAEDSDTAYLTDRTLSELSVRGHQNWFAHLTYIRPHPPLIAPFPYNEMYRNSNFPLPIHKENSQKEGQNHPFLSSYINDNKTSYFFQCKPNGFERSNSDHVKAARSIYMGLVSEVDHHIGRVIDHLKQTGQYNNTLIVIQADHGEMLGDHYMWGKQTIYDAAFHIPLIIRDPFSSQNHGDVVEVLTESIDITPTILDWAGQATPSTMDGRSLLPFLKGEMPKKWREHVYFELELGEPSAPTKYQESTSLDLHDANVAILREKQYKLVHFNGGVAPLLFDLQTDPNEFNNLANDAAFGHVLLAMTQKLLNHRMRNNSRDLADLDISQTEAT